MDCQHCKGLGLKTRYEGAKLKDGRSDLIVCGECRGTGKAPRKAAA